MSNNCLSVLYKHIIQVENKNVWLKVGGGTNILLPPTPPPPTPPSKKWKKCVWGGGGGGRLVSNIVLSRLLDTRDRVVPIVFTKIDEIAEIKRRYDVISLLLSAL